MPQVSTDRLKRPWYRFLRVVVRLTGVSLFRIRVFGAERVPKTGAVLLLSNHQSHLDPILIGMSCRRHLHFLARQTLFDSRALSWLIRSLNAIPIDRDGTGLAGLKETMRRLKKGEIVVLFPEGTRTADGEVKSLKSGFCTLARRCEVTLVPLAIDGAFDSWPRGAAGPKPRPISIVFGHPLSSQAVAGIASDQDLTQAVEAEIRRCHELARAQIRRGKASC